jgi:hypothetical protein
MTSSRHPTAAARLARGGGLAVPTMIAALLCGGSVFAIAASGALALDVEPVAAAVAGPGGPLVGGATAAAPGSSGTTAAVPPSSGPEAAPQVVISDAPTGRVYSIAAAGPGAGGAARRLQ